MKIEEISIEIKRKKDVLNFITSRKNEIFTVAEVAQEIYKKETVSTGDKIYIQIKQKLNELAYNGEIGKISRDTSRQRACLYGTTEISEQAKKLFQENNNFENEIGSEYEPESESKDENKSKKKTVLTSDSKSDSDTKEKTDSPKKENLKEKIIDLTDDDVKVKAPMKDDKDTCYTDQRTKYGLRKITVFDRTRLKNASSYVKNVEIRQMQMNGDGAERIFADVSNSNGEKYKMMMVKDDEGLWGECNCMDFKCNLPPEHACKHLIATAIKKGWHVDANTNRKTFLKEVNRDRKDEAEDKELKQQEKDLGEIMDY